MPELLNAIPDEMLRRIENADSSRQFDELFECAVDTCLSTPPSVEIKELSGEARVVSKLGVRGLRAALDLVSGTAIHTPRDNGIEIDTPLRYPERFGDATDFEVMAKTEALGEGLLNEAYLCLGDDVHEQIAKFRDAESRDDQVQVIEWLHTRLKELAVTDSVEDDESENRGVFYHPARLSPKLIGAYPHHNLPPTCLSVSVIGASFLHQAGAEQLHAGVMQTYPERQAMEAIMFLGELPIKAYQQYGAKLPITLLKSLKEIGHGAIEQTHQDRGYHTAVMTRLFDGEWVQIDPNFNATTIVTEDGSAALDGAYARLAMLHDVAPGLETTISTNLGTASHLANMMLETGDETLLGSPEAIKDILTDPSMESVYQLIREECLDPFFNADRESHPALRELWFQYTDMEKHDGEEDALTEGFYAMFDKYVLHSEPLEKVLERCRRNEGYLQDRIADARALPLMVVGWQVVQGIRHCPDIPNHVTFEVGLPATRIGSAVLNDFASYCDGQLPPSYRLSHWSSHVPITEVVPGALRSDLQADIVANNAHWLRTGLRYNKDYGIITPFLKLREHRQAEARNEDGAHQP